MKGESNGKEATTKKYMIIINDIAYWHMGIGYFSLLTGTILILGSAIAIVGCSGTVAIVIGFSIFSSSSGSGGGGAAAAAATAAVAARFCWLLTRC